MKRKHTCFYLFVISIASYLSCTAQAAFPHGDMDECTALAVGKKASADGSSMITHNDDSSIADFRLWLIPARDWPKKSKRDVVIYSHDYVDYGVYPPIYPEKPPFGKGAKIVGRIPQVEHTYAYLHSRLSFLNEKGVAISETTLLGPDTKTEYGKRVKKIMREESEGLIDCWFAIDVALERASTARQAVRIMGDLVERYGWAKQEGECILVTDGTDVWIAEFYGRNIWVAFRLPDDQVFASANRARINSVDFDDKENYMYSPNLVSFAVEQGWFDPKNNQRFRPNQVYCPSKAVTHKRREWRALDLMAPSLGLDPYADPDTYPLTVKPDKKLSVQDLFGIKGDYYGDTEFSLTVKKGKPPDAYTQFAGGPWGNPMRGSGFERSIGLHRTCYVHVSQVKEWLPDEIKGISWFGYGHPASTYLTPLWAIMKDLPPFYHTGSRADLFRRDSAWWVNIYTQRMAELCWNHAIENIREVRDPKMAEVYKEAVLIQEEAAKLIRSEEDEDDRHEVSDQVIDLIHNFAYETAVNWHKDWLYMGDLLLTKYWAIQARDAKDLPQWWKDNVFYQRPVR